MSTNLRFTLAATAAVCGLLLACSSAPDEESGGVVPAVDTNDTEAARLRNPWARPPGSIFDIDPTTYPTPTEPPVSCGSCTPQFDMCGCPHGLGFVSGVVCPYGRTLQCFNNYCGCY